MIIVPFAVGVIALGVFGYLRLRSVEGTDEFGAQGRGHDLEAAFVDSRVPLVGGDHDPRFQNCGIYTEPVPTGPAVHSMEHSVVWIAYHSDLPADDVATLQDMVRAESYLLLRPYPDMKGDVVVTALGVQLEPDSVEDARLG